MQKILLFPVLLLIWCAAFPQTEPGTSAGANDIDDIRTLFHKPGQPLKAGFFIGPEATWTRFDGRDVFLGGLSLGGIIDHWFSVGLGGYGILNSGNLWYDNISPVDSAGGYLYGGYGGVKFEFRVLPAFPVHVNFPLLIGGGGLVYNTWIYNYKHDNDYDGTTLDSDGFFVLEPGVMVEVNLVRFMRLDAGVTYRYSPDLDLVNTPKGLINTFNLNFSLKFGKF